MNYSKFRFTLDIHKHQSQVSIPVMYGDTAVQLFITLSDGGMPYTIGKSCWAQFIANKPSVDEPLIRACIIEDGTTIRLDFDADIANVAGVYNCEVRLYGAEGILTSPCFTMVVDPRVTNSIGMDSGEATDLLDQIGLAMSQYKTAEEGRAAAEEERVAADEGRATAENERKAAERLRGLAEAERVADEDARKAAETLRESAESERTRLLNEINKRLPIPGANDNGKYLKVDGNKWVMSDVPFIAPRLHAPVIESIDSRSATVAFSEDKNGAFGVKYKVYLDGEAVETVDGKSANFSDHIGDKVTCTVGVAATGDGFFDSAITEGRWGLSNGDAVGITYSPIHNGQAYEAVIVLVGQECTVASYIDGLPVEEANIDDNSGIDRLVFLGGLSGLSEHKHCTIGVMYLPYCLSAVDFENCTINRLYSLDNLPKEITNAVADLSPGNNFKCINTWCTGIGNDADYEWAYKPDSTVRVTCYIAGDSLGYREITIPDFIDGMPVNGLGKFFALANGYITGVVFGDNMRDINDSAMRNCTLLGSIKFGKGLESIGEHAFRYSAVTELDFSGCPVLREIKGRAFSNCSKLTKVTMPRSVKTIGSTAFASCSKLTDIYVPWSEGEVAGAPWGATNATVHYNSEV